MKVPPPPPHPIVPEDQVLQEWLLANRLGSFAMGTRSRVPERKYHGLLVSRGTEHPEPFHVLAEVGETVEVGGASVPLFAFRYRDAVHPQGFRHLVAFDCEEGGIRWLYWIGGLAVQRVVRLDPLADCLRISYRVAGDSEGARMKLRPFLSCRIAHQLSRENPFLDGRVTPGARPGEVVLHPYPLLPPLHLHVQGARFQIGGLWNRSVVLAEEGRRGYPETDDLYSPGEFVVDLAVTPEVCLEFSFGEPGEGAGPEPARPEPARPEPAAPPSSDTAATRARREVKESPAGRVRSLAHRLAEAAHAYLVRSPAGQGSVIAGYPWFSEWGRDAMISLPGLTLARGDVAGARALLDSFAARRIRGLVPNILGRAGSPSDVHSIDASLWYVRAVQHLEEHEGADAGLPYAPVVWEILDALSGHAMEGVHVTPEGELHAAANRPLTWMDAIVGGSAVTLRAPFAVEISALFYNALQYGLDLARRAENEEFARRWEDRAERSLTAFHDRFWLPAEEYLADSHDGKSPDRSVRPNQVIAAALPASPLTREMARKVVAAVEKSLLTPFGLRTLAPGDPRYRGQCAGKQAERDLAYHQGTVWPWLLGPYGDALVRLHGPRKARSLVRSLVLPFAEHIDQGCAGHIAEIFDGDPPHAARGAPAQAWSVAEILRLARFAEGEG
ncbi:MAG: glycogen debranching enzyme family protein [Planctomycetes bacterium]|nr:glycogen debranching enzyme family protein [Planctomycetota bacterium]